ncbi:MAG: OmpH family outer membrane protein [Sphingomicrobium sp.]
MKTIFPIAALAASLVALPTVASAQRAPAAVIVVIDNERIYRECNACKSASAQLQSMVSAAQTREKSLNSQLQIEGTAIQTAANALGGKEPDAALKARAQAFETKRNAATQELSRLQSNIQSTQSNVARQVNAKLGNVYAQVMTARGANLALDSGATLASASGLDVTTDVLTALNAALPSVSVTPMPASAAPKGR